MFFPCPFQGILTFCYEFPNHEFVIRICWNITLAVLLLLLPEIKIKIKMNERGDLDTQP